MYISKVSYEDLESVVHRIVRALGDVQVDHALYGAALTMCRLMNHDHSLEPEDEIKFVQALVEWTNLYWAPIHQGKVN